MVGEGNAVRVEYRPMLKILPFCIIYILPISERLADPADQTSDQTGGGGLRVPQPAGIALLIRCL